VAYLPVGKHAMMESVAHMPI